MKKIFKYSRQYPKLVIADTKKYGKGVFAGEDIKKRKIVYMLSGERMDIKDLVERVNLDKENIDDPFQIGRRTYIDLNETSRAFNHSCDPSVGVRNIGEMFALRDIKLGEEITYDYSLTISPTIWKMRCKCGSKDCRKILGDVLSIPSKRLAYYKQVGALQRYMKILLKEVELGKYKIPKYEQVALKKLKKTSEE